MSEFLIFGVFQMILHSKVLMSLRQVFTDRGSYLFFKHSQKYLSKHSEIPDKMTHPCTYLGVPTVQNFQIKSFI